MKSVRWLLIGIFLIGGAIFLGDFIISGGHPFYELGGSIGCFLVGAVLIFATVRSKEPDYK